MVRIINVAVNLIGLLSFFDRKTVQLQTEIDVSFSNDVS